MSQNFREQFWNGSLTYEEVMQMQVTCPHCGVPEPLATNLEISLMKKAIDFLIKTINKSGRS